MSNENSRDWLLENSALPLIETITGKYISFTLDINGKFFLSHGGYISNGVTSRGGVGSHGETA